MKKIDILKTILKSDISTFKCNFVKKNGEIREMICNFIDFHPSCENLVIVYDLSVDGYRNINLQTLIDITYNKRKISFNTL
jgi:hypothetical protein